MTDAMSMAVEAVAARLMNEFDMRAGFGASKCRNVAREIVESLPSLMGVQHPDREDIARAICNSQKGRDYDALTEFAKDWWRTSADAVLALPHTGQPVEGEDLASRERQEGERSAKDFAIEFAGYMATSTEHLLQYLSTPGEADAQLSTELIEGVRSGIYEFRKRAEKAASPPPPVAESGWQPIMVAESRKAYLVRNLARGRLPIVAKRYGTEWLACDKDMTPLTGDDAPVEFLDIDWLNALPAPPHIAEERERS